MSMDRILFYGKLRMFLNSQSRGNLSVASKRSVLGVMSGSRRRRVLPKVTLLFQ